MEEIQKKISHLKWLLENGGQLYYAARLEKIEKLLIKELEKNENERTRKP